MRPALFVAFVISSAAPVHADTVCEWIEYAQAVLQREYP